MHYTLYVRLAKVVTVLTTLCDQSLIELLRSESLTTMDKLASKMAKYFHFCACSSLERLKVLLILWPNYFCCVCVCPFFTSC